MKVLVTGSKGQLGFDIIRELKKRGHIAIGVDIGEMDITDINACRTVISNVNAEVVMHCAAYTAVDAAEDNEEKCRLINVTGTYNVANVCRELEIKMLYLSTDYVFEGAGDNFYEPEDTKAPINIYGKSKYDGELEIQKVINNYYIVRISWVFGINGNNFVKTMLKLSETRKSLTVVDDQIGSPTYTVDLAKLLVDMIETDKYGVYHATNEGVCSWYEFACEIFKQVGVNIDVKPVSSEEYQSKAKRPHNSRMSKYKLDEMDFERLPIWHDALKRFLEEVKNEQQ